MGMKNQEKADSITGPPSCFRQERSAENMTLNELINHAAEGYPDGILLEYWNTKVERPYRNPKAGDMLAYFIVVELAETYDSEASNEEQIREAIRVMTNAEEDIHGVISSLEGLL